MVLERLVHCLVQVAVVDLVGAHPGGREGQLVELASHVFTLLICALSGCRQGSEFGVDLEEEFAEFGEVEAAALVLVVLFEEFVEAAEMV